MRDSHIVEGSEAVGTGARYVDTLNNGEVLEMFQGIGDAGEANVLKGDVEERGQAEGAGK
jgi:hypothetical protein